MLRTLICTLFLHLGVSSVANAQCPQPREVDSRKDYGRSVFRVSGYKKDGGELRLGTAILVHPDGFALTASHIFDLEGNVLAEYGKGGYPQTGRLRLKNVESGYEVDARIWRKRRAEDEPDIALLKLSSAPPESLKFPDVSLGWFSRETGGSVPYINELAKYVVLGYRIQDDDLKVHQFTVFNVEWEAPRFPIFVLESGGPVFGGQSGSSALGMDGMSFGVLRGEPVRQFGGGVETLAYRFTPTAEIARLGWAGELPLTTRVSRVIEKIRAGQLDAATRGDVRQLRIIEVWQVVNHLPLLLKKGPLVGDNRWLAETLMLMAACNGMPDVALRIPSLMPSLFARSNQTLDVARVFLARYDTLRSGRAPKELQKASLAHSLRFFDMFDKNTERVQGKYHSNGYYDLARATFAASNDFPELGRGAADALRYAEVAAKLDPTNSHPFVLQSQIFARQQQYERAAESANRAISVNPEIRGAMERDIRYYGGREAAVRQAQ